MKKVITINLNGNAYSLEEAGFEALQRYLEQARKKLHDNPDCEEIISDFEQAIAEKCMIYLTSSKTVILSEEIEKIIAEMGPVGESEEQSYTTQQDSEHAKNNSQYADTGAAGKKKFYLFHEGAYICGVCKGVSVHFDIDVNLVRIVFVILAFITHGIWIGIYFIAVAFVPYADTLEKRAAAHGAPFRANEFIEELQRKYAASGLSKKEKWEPILEAVRSAAFIGGRVILAVIIFYFFLAALWSIMFLHQGTIFGWNGGLQPFALTIATVSTFYLLFWPARLLIDEAKMKTESKYSRKPQRHITQSQTLLVLGWIVWTFAFADVAVIVSTHWQTLYSTTRELVLQLYNENLR